MTAPHRRALDAPEGTLVVLSRAQVDAAAEAARASDRQRVIQPLHKSEAEPLQRMFNVIQPGSYVRPHRHVRPPLAESWVVLRGAVAFFTFEDDGRVRDCLRLEAGGHQPLGAYDVLVANLAPELERPGPAERK